MTARDGETVVPQLDSASLLAAVPELDRFAEIESVSFRNLPGAHLTVDDLLELSAEIVDRFDHGVDGVVITQGTDTVEETSFALDLLVDRDNPVVVTGAMRNPSQLGADGPANLLAAVVVAASQVAHGLGTLVVLNDEIHSARYVQKRHVSSPAAFGSPLTGAIGWVSEGQATIAMRPFGIPKIALKPPRAVKSSVALLTAALGEDGRLIPMVLEQGYSGLVFEGLGNGHVPPVVADHLGTVAKSIPVVLASRTRVGQLLRRTYGFEGSETDLLGRGIISSGWLDAPKARIACMLLLDSGATRSEIFEWFSLAYPD